MLGFAKITHDITERREAQRALEKAQEVFFQSQKMEAIGQLTGGIAHDFNNLLAAVLGSLDLLRKRLPGDPKSMRLLDNAVQGARRGAALTQRMLAFARRQDLKIEAVHPCALIDGLVDLLQTTLGPTVELEVDCSSELPLFARRRKSAGTGASVFGASTAKGPSALGGLVVRPARDLLSQHREESSRL